MAVTAHLTWPADATLVSRYQDRFSNCLDALQNRLVQDDDIAPRLRDCMLHVLTARGKHLRPCLVYACGESLGIKADVLDAIATAVELIHLYSLVHDDLPCMDDATLRHGKPTAHIPFDVATAMMAGNALQCMAFEQLAQEPLAEIIQLNVLCTALARASGAAGIMSGQVQDLYDRNRATADSLLACYRQKTGALLGACLELPTLCSPELDPNMATSLRKLGEMLGMAYQIQDDLLDELDSEATGKDKHLDADNGVPSFPRLLGPDEARKHCQALFDDILQALQKLGLEGSALAKTIGVIANLQRNA